MKVLVNLDLSGISREVGKWDVGRIVRGSLGMDLNWANMTYKYEVWHSSSDQG